MNRKFPEDRRKTKACTLVRLRGSLLRSFAASILPILPIWLFGFITLQGEGDFLVEVAGAVYGLALPPLWLTLSGLFLRIFVCNPMEVEMARYFLKLQRTKKEKLNPLSVCECFKTGYFRNVITIFIRDLVIAAVAVLPIAVGLLIPGTHGTVVFEGTEIASIKPVFSVFPLLSSVLLVFMSLRYALVPYCAADQEQKGFIGILRGSTENMRGRKWEMFTLWCSFLLWGILTSITYIAGVIYYPYRHATQAAYYLLFKGEQPAIYDITEEDIRSGRFPDDDDWKDNDDDALR